MIKHLKLEISKLRCEHYGHSSERRARLIDQMELQLEELEAAATEDEIGAQNVAKISASAARRANLSRTICRASAGSSKRPPPAPAADRTGS